MGIWDIGFEANTGRKTIDQTVVKQKQFSQEAIDKTIYDILSSDQGLAALSSAENASGGSGSSGKTLLAQDLIAKVAGTIAQITAPEVETTAGVTKTQETKSKAGSKLSVICTYLAENGYIPLPLYLRGMYYHSQMNEITREGYLSWAFPAVERMKKSPRLCKFLAYLTISRYEYIVTLRPRFWGMLSVYVGEPICYAIGYCLTIRGHFNGRTINQ